MSNQNKHTPKKPQNPTSELQAAVSAAFGVVKSGWVEASKAVTKVVEHALKHSMSMNLVEFTLNKAVDADHKQILACVKRVFKDCLAAKFEEQPHGDYKVTLDKGRWKKIKENGTAEKALAKLQDGGLKAFVKPKSTNSGNTNGKEKAKHELAFIGINSMIAELSKYPERAAQAEALAADLQTVLEAHMLKARDVLLEVSPKAVKRIAGVYFQAVGIDALKGKEVSSDSAGDDISEEIAALEETLEEEKEVA